MEASFHLHQTPPWIKHLTCCNPTDAVPGFFVLAGLLLVVSMLMCLFPKRLPTSPEPTRPEEKQADTEDAMMDKMMGSMSELHTGARPAEKLGGLKEALLRLVKNPLLMVLLLNVVFAVTGFIGYFTFMPKYQQTAFKQSAAKASLFSGEFMGLTLGQSLAATLWFGMVDSGDFCWDLLGIMLCMHFPIRYF